MRKVPDEVASPVRRIYQVAKGLADDRRNEYLQFACQHDASLLDEVQQLLAADLVRANNVLQRAIDKVAPLVEERWNEKEIPTAWQSPEGDAASESRESPELPPGCCYALAEKVGEGGMGIVYRARQTAPLERTVAIKVIKPGMDSHTVLRRFRTEQQAMARMAHPHIASVFDSGTTTLGHPYFVMEFVNGTPLDEFCRTRELPLAERLWLIIETCSAIHHAHQQSIVHRDLKPSNLLVTQLGDRPCVKVIDFGVAKALDQDACERTQFTHFAQCIGTPLYMSPEQVAFGNESIDARSDVYALGAILYLLITGQPPFTPEVLYAAGFDGLRKMIRDVDPLTPSARLRASSGPNSEIQLGSMEPAQGAASNPARLREELDWIVMRALAKEPERRYASAQELGDDLLRFLRHETVLAARPSVGYRFSRFVRRQREPLAFAALLATTLIAVGLAFWAFNHNVQPSPTYIQTAITPVPNQTVDKPAQIPTAEQQPSSLDVLEAANLQQLLIELAASNLASMNHIDLPRTSDGRFLGSSEADESDLTSLSLRSLLTDVSRPTPEHVFQHPDRVTDAMLSPDGSRVATTCADGLLRIWQADTGELLHKLGPHKNAAESVAYSPDGKRLASGDKEGVVYLWDAETGRRFYATEEHQGGAESIAWSPDGMFLAIGIRYDGVDVLHAHDGSRYCWIDGGEDQPRYEQILFSPSGDELYVPAKGVNSRLHVWDVATKKLSRTIGLTGIEHPVRTMSFIGRERNWLVAGDRIIFAIKDVHDNSQTLDTFAPGPSFARRLSVSPEGQTLAGAFLGGQVVVWQVDESKSDQPPKLDIKVIFNAHDPNAGRVTSLQLANENKLLTAGEDGRVCLWDLDNVLPFRSAIIDLAINVMPLAGEQFLTLSSEAPTTTAAAMIVGKVVSGTARPREVFRSEMSSALLTGINHTAYRADVLAVAGSEFIELRSTRGNWDQLQRIAVAEPMPSISFSSTGQRLYAIGRNSVSIHESTDGWQTSQAIASWESDSNSGYHVEADHGRTLLVEHQKSHREDTNFVEEFRVSDGTRGMRTWGSSPAIVAVSGNNRLIALGTHDSLELYDRESAELVWRQVLGKVTRQLAFADHDRILVALQSDNQLRAWHLSTKQALGNILAKEITQNARALLFPSNGRNRLCVWCRYDLRDEIFVLGH